ncbi:MAG TPA: AAA family ATPase [Patescibacteria group bacterium]|nr:AAA family ATPase [Patescibacteria group bacterium]
MKFTLDLSKGETKPMNPSCLDGFIGQDNVIKRIEFFAASSSEETPFPTLLFTGSHGLGKTYLSEKVANVLGRKFVTINCGNIKKREEFLSLFSKEVRGPSTIFLDESHGLSKELETLLLTLLNPTPSHLNYVAYEDFELVFNMKRINVIFATTDAHLMFRPLLNRCQKVYFESYSNESIIEILKFYLGNVKFSCDLNDLADACRSRARDAYLLSQNVKRYMTLNKIKTLTQKDWQSIKSVFDIYPKGLHKEEVNLLEAIRDFGPISSANLALRLMVNESNVKSEMEIRLRELGLIKSTSKGREITKEGLEYFSL